MTTQPSNFYNIVINLNLQPSSNITEHKTLTTLETRETEQKVEINPEETLKKEETKTYSGRIYKIESNDKEAPIYVGSTTKIIKEKIFIS